MTTFRQKKGDVGTVITVRLEDRRGPVDLTGAQIRFLASKTPGRPPVKIDGVAQPDVDQNLNKGQASYVFLAGDLDTKDTYVCEWEVTWGATKRTFPNDNYDVLAVLDDLG